MTKAAVGIVCFVLGAAGGVSVPYLYNLVAMVLRHCGGV